MFLKICSMFAKNLTEIQNLFYSSNIALFVFEIAIVAIYIGLWIKTKRNLGAMLAHQFFLSYVFLSFGRALLYYYNFWQNLAFTLVNSNVFSIPLNLSFGLMFWLVFMSKEKKWRSSVYDTQWNIKKLSALWFLLFYFAVFWYSVLYYIEWHKPYAPMVYIWPWYQSLVWAIQVVWLPIFIKIAFQFAQKRQQGPWYAAFLTVLISLPLLLWDVLLVRMILLMFRTSS